MKTNLLIAFLYFLTAFLFKLIYGSDTESNIIIIALIFILGIYRFWKALGES